MTKDIFVPSLQLLNPYKTNPCRTASFHKTLCRHHEHDHLQSVIGDSISFKQNGSVKLRNVDTMLCFLSDTLPAFISRIRRKYIRPQKIQSREDVKVLHLLSRTTTSGATLGVMNTMKGLKKLGYKVYFAGSANGEFAKTAYKYADKVYDLPQLQPNEFTKEASDAIEKVIQEVKPDIIHTHYTVAGTLGRYLAAKNDAPIIINTYQQFPWHDYTPLEQKNKLVAMETMLNRISDKLIVLSQNNKDEIVGLGVAKKGKVVVVPAGSDFSKLDVVVDVNQKKKELGLEHLHYPVIGTVSRSTEQKSIETLIKAAKHVLQKVDAYFVIVAGGHLFPKHEALIKQIEEEIGKKGMIKLFGARHDVPEVIKTYDVFALPSIFEAFGMVLTEASYNKLPIVASNIDGIPFTVKHNKTGFLLPPKDDKAFASKILQLIQNPKLRKKMGENGYKFVYPSRSAQNSLSIVDKTYIQALKNKFGRFNVSLKSNTTP